MPALKLQSLKRHTGREPVAPAPQQKVMVLPRPVRRVVRFMSSLAGGRVHIPEHVGTVSAIAFLASVGIYGMVLGGHADAVAQATTTAAGFAIEDVKVSGNVQTSEIEILQVLGLDGATSLMALNAEAAKSNLEKLPWVEKAEVRKIYPKTVDVRLVERQAYAIWQHGSDLSLIEKSGSVIAPLKDGKFVNLPLLVGRDAEVAAREFDADFAAWPDVKARVRAYVRVGGRRWDLYLNNGVIVKLPQDGIDQALAELSDMERSQQLLEREIASVDFRLADRTTIELTPDAAKRRDAAVAVRMKELKKAERQI